MLLELDGVERRFGGVRAVDGVSGRLLEGRVLGLIGPNGSGKTTLLNVISAILRPTGGRVLVGGMDTRRWTPRRAASAGIGRTFQVPQAMADLSVLENVMLGPMFGSRGQTAGEARAGAMSALEEVGLVEHTYGRPTQLSLAQRKQLELARLLAAAPVLALVDEVMAGLSPAQMEMAEKVLSRLRARGVGLIVVEHVPGVIARIADEICVLHHGRVLAWGAPREVLAHPQVVAAYLGAVHV